MNGIDVREAARVEAERRFPTTIPELADERAVFVGGAQWAVEQLPSRDEIAAVIATASGDFPRQGLDPARSWADQEGEEYADAVLALIREKVGGRDDEAARVSERVS